MFAISSIHSYRTGSFTDPVDAEDLADAYDDVTRRPYISRHSAVNALAHEDDDDVARGLAVRGWNSKPPISSSARDRSLAMSSTGLVYARPS